MITTKHVWENGKIQIVEIERENIIDPPQPEPVDPEQMRKAVKYLEYDGKITKKDL